MLGDSKASKEINESGLEWKPKRRFPRMDTLGRVFAGLGEGQEGSVVNLSLGGLLLRLKRTLKPGSSYFLKLFLGSEVAVVEARVVRLVTGNEEYLAGMEFIRIARQDKVILQNYVGSVGSMTPR
jgi:hypothetical protein